MANKGVRDQMLASDKTTYEAFNLEALVDYCLELTLKENERELKVITGKQGAINCIMAIYNKCEIGQHVKRVKMAYFDRFMEEGLYECDKLGIRKI